MISILLVEDDPVNQKLACQLLEKWSIEVTVASDGAEALDLLQQGKFTIVLMDLNMPVMDGFEATRRIRSLPDPVLKNIPILAYTSLDDIGTKENLQRLGMTDFVSKPLNAPDLHCKINQYANSDLSTGAPVNIRLESYGDYDDECRRELVRLMVKNLRELQMASYQAYYSGEKKQLAATLHKVKTTLTLLDNRELSYRIDDLNDCFNPTEKQSARQEKISRFNQLTEQIIRSLLVEAERNALVNQSP